MSATKTEKTGASKAARKGKDRAAEVTNTLEWLITAFILAFVFRAFVMEAFRIPTGSMADTLKGAHFRLRCPQCGYKYHYGFVPERYRLPEDTVPSGDWPVPTTRCPSCGYWLMARAKPVANGDRILVLKCIYQFFEPRRWDVVVFKNPLDPTMNYIKRLVGLPGEQVEIIDGDVYVAGEICRKPSKVQEGLWMPVYDNDYQPVRPHEGSFNRQTWQQPFKNEPGSKWILNDKNSPTLFRLDSSAEQVNTMMYDSSDDSSANDFRATYAYDEVEQYGRMPYCSDLMVRFYCQSAEPRGRIGIAMSKYQTDYRAWVDFGSAADRGDSTAQMVITKVLQGEETRLASKSIKLPAVENPTLIRFANVDHQLVFQLGSERLTLDLGREPLDDIEQRNTEPQVKVFGAGQLVLSHVAIFRDIHYTQYRLGNHRRPGRATEGDPFVLREDQFFVLGDNSPNSEDCRWWDEPGEANVGSEYYRQGYRKGIVPRDYLVGKALFVYWPSGFEFPWPKSLRMFLLQNSEHNGALRAVNAIVSLRWIPNMGQMRFIYGGSRKDE